MNKGFKFRIYPNQEQETLIIKTFGCTRWIWNKMLADRGKVFHKIDKWFASSKTCSICGCYHPELVNSLNIRTWKCQDCDAEHDRDINAANNIRNKGINEIISINL